MRNAVETVPQLFEALLPALEAHGNGTCCRDRNFFYSVSKQPHGTFQQPVLADSGTQKSCQTLFLVRLETGTIAVPPMLETRLQRAVYYSISKMLAGTFQQAQMPENTSRQLQTPLPCLQCWEQGLKELSGTDTAFQNSFQQAQMPKTRPGSWKQGFKELPYTVFPQRFETAGTFQQPAPLPYFPCWKQGFKKLPDAAGWHVSASPRPGNFKHHSRAFKAGSKALQRAARHCFYSVSKLLAGTFQQAQMPETCPGSFRHHCYASNAGSRKVQKAARHCLHSGSKLQPVPSASGTIAVPPMLEARLCKSCQALFLQRFETAGWHVSTSPNA